MTGTALKRSNFLFDNLELIEPRIRSASHIALFLDFDGTISPIAPTPGEATLDTEIRSILERLRVRPDFSISIVSGRSLADVRERAGIENAIYVGNHGLEIEGASSRLREPHAEALRRELKSVCLQLKLALSDTEGLEVEEKGLTASVHYRRVNEELHAWVEKVACETIGRSRSFTTRMGKKVLEVRPEFNWHKGHAVKWILAEILPSDSLPIYVGDDMTDEDAFAAIPQGITIRVGGTFLDERQACDTRTHPVETAAQYLVPDVSAVGQFLDWLDHAKSHASFANAERAGT